MRHFLLVSVCIHLALLLQWKTSQTISLGSLGQQLHIALSPTAHDDRTQTQAFIPKSSKSDVTSEKPGPDPASDHNTVLIPAGSEISQESENSIATSGMTSDLEISATIQRHLAAHFSYPRLAKRRGWEGEVRLQVQLESDGRVSDVTVADSSGYPVLDRAAVRAAQKVAYIPETRQWLTGNAVRMIIPVHYRLLDS